MIGDDKSPIFNIKSLIWYSQLIVMVIACHVVALDHRRLETFTCTVHCMVISIHFYIIILHASRELNVIDSSVITLVYNKVQKNFI